MTRNLIREFALDAYAFLAVVLFLIVVGFFLGRVETHSNHSNVGASAKNSRQPGLHF